MGKLLCQGTGSSPVLTTKTISKESLKTFENTNFLLYLCNNKQSGGAMVAWWWTLGKHTIGYRFESCPDYKIKQIKQKI
jgi:hypothetical protein